MNILQIIETAEVEWKVLGEIAILYGGLTGKNKNDFENGNAKYVTYKNIFNNIEINANQLESVKVLENEKQYSIKYGDVLFTGSSEIAKEVAISSAVTTHFDEPIYLNSFSFGLRFNDDIRIIPEFSKYLFRSNFMRQQIVKTASGVTRFNVSKKRFKKIIIPIPPLNLQKKIVEILDKITELEDTLEAELALRAKQYQYYRNLLLDFNNQDGTGSWFYKSKNLLSDSLKVEWKTLEEVFHLKNGYTPSKNNKEFWGNGTIPWFIMEDIRENGRILDTALQQVSETAVKGGKLFPANSIIMATSATIGEHALITVPFLANQRFTVLSIKNEFIEKVNMNFVFYYCFNLSEWCKKNTTISSFPSVDMASFRNFQIPIPPLETQAKIVEILDKFYTFTYSLSEGLPREIALRQKQYQYHREQLLNFTRRVEL